MSLKKLEEDPSEAAFYEGYRQGHRDTARMLARKALVYLFLGGFLGVATMFLAFNTGILEAFRNKEEVIEDPALSVEKPKEFANAIKWAKRFTVGIVAETSGARTSSSFGSAAIPGQQHIGSGIVLNDDGYILTNSHVIPDSTTSLGVVLGDQIYEARFVGRRPEYDIAIIKIKAENVIPATLGDSDKVEQGDVVIAIGSPYGLFHTATDGIISYVGRPAQNSLVRNYLQTSAAINHGNSGGPLIDLTGRVIGINTWKYANDGEDDPIEGIGFAIPINVARKVADQIIGSDDRRLDDRISGTPSSARGAAFLGVRVESGIGERSDEGVVVREVIVHSAAERAGLRRGDVITRLGDAAVKTYGDLTEALSKHTAGDEIDLHYLRDGQETTAKVTLGN